MSEPEPSGSFPPPAPALSDARLAALIAAALFGLAAWPLLLVDLPQLQDLPNHVATAHIIAHPDLYPEYAFNGLFKSNCLLTLWFHLFGGHGLFGAARVFVALVLAINAIALPVFILRFAGRQALVVAALFVWPMVHSFSVARGFLNFAFAFGLSLILLVLIDRQRERATPARGAGIALTACALWYAHPFPLMVVGALAALHAATRPGWAGRRAAAVALLLPLAPAALLSAASARAHLVKDAHSTAAASATSFYYQSPWEMLAHLWTDVSGAVTLAGSMTVVPALLLAWYAWRRRHLERPLLSRAALACLIAAYVALPMMLSNWWHLNCRLVPYLWAGLALRLPDRVPRSVAGVLAVCALSFSVVTGVDYRRLDRDRAEFTAGIDAVPERATLLPLLFNHSKTSAYMASLTHAWADYTLAKNTSAPFVFAVERSYPIIYREFPPPALIPPALDRFARDNATPALVCRRLNQSPDDASCAGTWRALWDGFWRQATPRFSHLLVWAIPPEARPVIPPAYRRVFAAGDLEIYARGAGN